jgi:phage terminase large subunit GpA-like protein
MIDLVFSCPTTGEKIEPGIDDVTAQCAGTDGVRFAALYVRCPHCGEHHEIKIGDVALNEAA